jgi:hypothetical protein
MNAVLWLSPDETGIGRMKIDIAQFSEQELITLNRQIEARSPS